MAENAVKVGPFDPDLALNVEERLIEEGTELGSVVPRDQDGLAQELGPVVVTCHQPRSSML